MQILFNKYRANDENDEQIEGKLSGVVGMLRNDLLAGLMSERWFLMNFLHTAAKTKSQRESFVVFGS